MNKNKKVITILLVIVIIITAFYLYNSIRLNNQIKELEEQIIKEEELVTFLENEIENYEDILTEEATFRLYNRFPAEEGYPQLVQDFNQIATKNNVAITSMTSNTVSEGELPYQTLSYTIKASSSSYSSIRLFLQDLYDNERLINIDDLQINSKKDGITSEFNATTYYSKVMEGLIPELEPVEGYPPAGRVNPFKY